MLWFSYRKLEEFFSQDKLKLDHFFLNLQLFLEGAHADLWEELNLKKLKNLEKLEKQVAYFEEQIYKFLSILPKYHPEGMLVL